MTKKQFDELVLTIRHGDEFTIETPSWSILEHIVGKYNSRLACSNCFIYIVSDNYDTTTLVKVYKPANIPEVINKHKIYTTANDICYNNLKTIIHKVGRKHNLLPLTIEFHNDLIMKFYNVEGHINFDYLDDKQKGYWIYKFKMLLIDLLRSITGNRNTSKAILCNYDNLDLGYTPDFLDVNDDSMKIMVNDIINVMSSEDRKFYNLLIQFDSNFREIAYHENPKLRETGENRAIVNLRQRKSRLFNRIRTFLKENRIENELESTH